MLSGKVDHAIRFTAECTDDAYIWPARHEAGSCGADYPPMGARFRLSASFSASEICKPGTPYCAQLAVVITAMQHYGLILADNGSNWYFQGSAFPQWPITLVDMMKQIPARDFVAVDESCLEVGAELRAGLGRSLPEGLTAAPARTAGAARAWTLSGGLASRSRRTAAKRWRTNAAMATTATATST